MLAQLGEGQEFVHVTTYFATRILYQRGKLDLSGVIARLTELLRACPDFPEALAMLRAAERGTLRPDAPSFNSATLHPPDLGHAKDGGDGFDRLTEPGGAPSSIPTLEARLKTPQAPSIPRAPLVPRFTPAEGRVPSVVPTVDLDLTPPVHEFDLVTPNVPEVALNLRSELPESGATGGERNTIPSPGTRRPSAPVEPANAFLITTWLAEHDYERALSAIEALGTARSPELCLLEVRAQLGLGHRAAARRALDRFCKAPLIDPDLRAASARLLVELGDLDRAEAQARRAHSEDPDAELSRLTLAWAIARSDSWLLSAGSAAELAALLRDFAPEACALPALGYALRALILTHSGSLEQARKAAESALLVDPVCLDGLAAAAIVAQKQAHKEEAIRRFQRLLELDHHAADELSQTLLGLGLSVGRSRPTDVAPAPSPPTLLWDATEQLLASGRRAEALERFEHDLCRQLEAIPARASSAELSLAAVVTARWLTESPVSRHFAPFDLSLFSIARLDAALSLLYASVMGSSASQQRSRALLGLGAYTGECLRQAYAGEWVGSTSDLLRLHVEGPGACFTPFRDVAGRMQAGKALQLSDAPAPPHPGAEPLGQRISMDLAPPSPWDPEPWPRPEEVAELGARLAESPVGLYCALVELPLNLTLASLRSIDRYVTLLAPPLAPPDPEAPWVRRASVLVGAYVGETLRQTLNARWDTPGSSVHAAEAFALRLPNGARVLPIAAAFERLSGRRLEQPSDYVRRVTA